MVTNNAANNSTGASGTILQGAGIGTASTYSTATYPSTAGTAGKILISDGTNIVSSTPTYPNTSGTAGKVVVSDGTNNVYSTPTFPNASATTRKIIVSDGTNWVASTETWATPGSSGNFLKSDGTNWTSAAGPAAGGITWIATQTASSSTTIDFANNLTSTYDNYLVTIEDVKPATDGVKFQLRVGTGSTPTYQTSAYSGVASYDNTSSGSHTASGTGTLDIIAEASNGLSNAANRSCGGFILVTNANNSSDDKVINSALSYWESTNHIDTVNQFAGRWQSGTVITSLRFLMSSGAITTGTFKLYGYQN